jgi:hypothetical protein
MCAKSQRGLNIGGLAKADASCGLQAKPQNFGRPLWAQRTGLTKLGPTLEETSFGETSFGVCTFKGKCLLGKRHLEKLRLGKRHLEKRHLGKRRLGKHRLGNRRSAKKFGENILKA